MNVQASRRAYVLVGLMLLAVWSPLATPWVASGQSGQIAEWGSEGSNDTGWIRMEAIGADPALGQMAVSNLMLDFAPGAEIDNLTFEIRVDGGNGTWIDQPQLFLPDGPATLLDWRGLGGLGQQNDFIGPDPHSSRLAPNSDANAGWVLPGGATVTDVVIEALRPADPLVSLERIDVEVRASATHPTDGRLYIAFPDAIVQIDANNDPPVIHIHENIDAVALAIDASGGYLHAADSDGTIHLISLDDSGVIGTYQPTSGTTITALEAFGPGFLFASDGASLFQVQVSVTSAGINSNWNEVGSLASNGAGATDMMIVSTDVWVSTDGAGLFHYDASTGSVQHYDTQNALPSDRVMGLEMANTHLLICMADAGITRRDLATGNWLATWNSGNWLASDEIRGASAVDGWVHILAGDTIHAYNTTSLSFTTSQTVSDLDLSRATGNALVPWPGSGARAPSQDTVLVGDGSGSFAILEPQSNPAHAGEMVLATGPSEDDMRDVIELNGIVHIAAGQTLQRFDIAHDRWLLPFSTQGFETLSIITDGTDLFIGTEGGGLLQMAQNGTLLAQWRTGDGLSSNTVAALAIELGSSTIITMHPEAGLSVVNPATGNVTDTWTTQDGLQTNRMSALTVRDGIAYAGTVGDGIERIDLTNLTLLTPWTSTGVDDTFRTPIAVDGTTLYLGLYGYGVIIYNLATGEQIDVLRQQGGSNRGLPSNNVKTLFVESPGAILIGTQQGAVRYTANGISNFGSGGGWFGPSDFNDFEIDNSHIYAATNAGVCSYARSGLNYQGCWDDDDGLPGEYTQSLEMLETDRLYVGQFQGAAVIDIGNDTVIHTWEAGVNTNNAKTVVHNNIAYIGYDGIGIMRYDLVTDEWLSPWDETNILDDNGVTALIEDAVSGFIWVGGEGGLEKINLATGTVVQDWDLGNNAGGVSLPSNPPVDLVIIGSRMYYAQQRPAQWSTNDNIYSYDVTNHTQYSTIDAGASVGYSAFVHGIGAVGDILHIGISPTNWQTSDGHMIRWNHSSSSWLDSVASDGQVNRVNARFAGDCAPVVTSDCHLYAAYGDTPLHQVSMSGNLVQSWDDTVIEGPIRGIDTWGDTVLFATESGIERYDFRNDTWLSTWTEGSGLPQNTENGIYAMEVIGDDLWVSSMTNSGWNRNAKLLQRNGTSQHWTVHDVGSGQIPQGYGSDFGLCDGIVHAAIGRTTNFGTQGGVARFDLNSGLWLADWNQGQGGLPHDFASGIACDEAYDIVYIGFQEDDGSIARYDYVNLQFLAVLDEDDNVVSEPIFPGAMHHTGGTLLVGHFDGGGITLVGTTGAIVNTIIGFDQGTETTSIEPVPGVATPQFALGRAGGSSGYNRVDHYDSNGMFPGGWDVLATLSTGRIAEITGNATHIWVTPIDDYYSAYGSAVLEGRPLANGSVEWLRAWNFNTEVVNELLLDGTDLWVTTAGWGLIKIDLVTGTMRGSGTPLHYQQDGMAVYGNEIIVGLMGTAGTAAGVQRFDLANGTWGAGRLAAGLPSNFVNDFEKIGDLAYIATSGGLGVWNISADDWHDPITTADGLATPVLNHLTQHNGDLLVGTGMGMFRFTPSTQNVGPMFGRNQGLIGNSVDGFAWDSSGNDLYISHSGEGATRPGFSELTTVGAALAVVDTTLIDVLPSNEITALASDWWGVHIATDEAPMMHWNASALEMEQGVASWALRDWPVTDISSDGNHLIAVSAFGIDRIDVSGAFHPASALFSYAGLESATITSNGVFAVGGDGLHVWSGSPAFIMKERSSMRRAEPLMVNFAGSSTDVTSEARPGNRIVLIDPASAVTLPDFGTAGPANIPMTQDMLTLSSPVSGAATWASSLSLNYSGTWDLAELDTTLQDTVQIAIDNSILTTMGRSLHLQLQSPRDGVLEVRLTYDWVRSESPSELIDIFDRPEDGGGVLTAQWTVTQDPSFASYRLYLREGSNWTSPPTSADLVGQTWDARLPEWQRTTTDINSHAGQPLIDGASYWAIIVIEYPDGSIGEPSSPIGPATPTDEIPFPPAWAAAASDSDGEDGDLFVEWAPCTEHDAHVTRIWASPDSITDAVGLTGSVDLGHDAGNSTTLSLQEGRPYWVAFTCVDAGGQHDPANATIVGPVVPTGGLDDGTPPAPMEDIDAWDTPDDEGGRINVSWTPNTEDDCAWYTVYIVPQTSDDPPEDAQDAKIASVVTDCALNGTIISEIDGAPLQDQQPYWITVVASDKWGNANLFNLTWVASFSVQNNMGVDPPPRVEGLAAWDHPDDDGTAIDVQWDPTEVDDFDFYVVWASEHSLADVALKWVECKDDPAACGLLVVRQQRQTAEGPIEVTLGSALYGADLGTASAATIIPNQPIWVTVTIHDVKGNAFLTRLSDHMTMVTPIDNAGDRIAPDRIEHLSVRDRPADDGTALLLEFDESAASDLSHYEVYADVVPFDDVGPRQPAMTLNRDVDQPVELEKLSSGRFIEPGSPVWVAVVAVDSMGNAWLTDLSVVQATPVDDSLIDPGLHLPVITGISAEWNAEGTEIIVSWDESRDPQVRGYTVHLSDEVYQDNRFASLGNVVLEQGTHSALNASTFNLSNDQFWYVSVVASDGEVTRFGVDPVRVEPWEPGKVTTPSDEQTEEGSGDWWKELGAMEIALIAILSMMILLLSMIIVIRLRKLSFDPLEHATSNWALQVEDWSDEGHGLPMDPDSDFDSAVTPAAESTEAAAAPPTDPNTGFAPEVSPAPVAPLDDLDDLDDLASDLLGTGKKDDVVDTSFLDDLL